MSNKENPVSVGPASVEKLLADLKKKSFALESIEALLSKARDENKRLERERDNASREAQEAHGAKCRAEDALAAAIKEVNGKNDMAIMLNLELHKMKAVRGDEEAQHRALVLELQQLRLENAGAKQTDQTASREVYLLQDTVATLQTALEKEKAARASQRQDAVRAEESHIAAARAASAERDIKEGKLRAELQEASEHISRLKNEAKLVGKESHDRIVKLEAEACSLTDKLEQAKQETKKLKERLDQSQAYIEILTNKQQNRRQSVAPGIEVPVPLSSASALASVEELQVHCKSLEHQNGLLQTQVASFKRREGELLTQVKTLEKREADLVNAVSNAEIRIEQSAHEIKGLTLSLEQYKQSQRAIEQRALGAERALEDQRNAVSLNAENALSSENKSVVEQRKLKNELDRAVHMHEIAISRLQEELREAREERDGALDMVATFQLESEETIERATRQLKEENAALRQSASALQHRNTEQASRMRELEAALQKEMHASEHSIAGQKAAANDVANNVAMAGLAEAHERLKSELQQVRSHLSEEVESMTVLLEQEMESHHSTREQLSDARDKCALQEQTVASLKVRVEELLLQTNQLAAHARDASEGDRAKVEALQQELLQQKAECESLRQLVQAKDQRLESTRLQIETLNETENKLSQRHDQVRARLDQLIAQDHESQRVISALQDAKRRLQERLDEHEADSTAQASSLSNLLHETQGVASDLEASLREMSTKLEAEMLRSASLQKRINALEIDLSHAVEALRRAETSSRSTIEQLNEQLVCEARRLETLREESIKDAERKIGVLTKEVEGLRHELSAQTQRSHIASSDLAAQNEILSQELHMMREAQKDREAAAAVAEVKRTQAEAAANAAMHRADGAETEVRREREALAQALREVDMCRNMVAEAELASETLQLDLQEARRDAKGQLQKEMDSMRECLEDAQLKADEYQLRAQQTEMQLEQEQRDWARERELLKRSLFLVDSKSVEHERELESRLFEANRALFDAKNTMSDVQSKYSDAMIRLEAGERKLEALQEEKRKREMNLQIQVDELEEELAECKSNADRATEKLRADMELMAQQERDKVRRVQEEAEEARHRALQGASELSQTESMYRTELADLTRRYALLKVDLDSKCHSIDTLTQENVGVLQQLDSVNSEVHSLKLERSQALRTIEEREDAIRSLELELERLTSALAESEGENYSKLSHAREQVLALEDRIRALKSESDHADAAHEIIVAELRQAVAVSEEQCVQLKAAAAKDGSRAVSLDQAISEWRKRCHDLETQLQVAQDELARSARLQQMSEQTTTRKEKELMAEAARYSDMASQLERKMIALHESLDVTRGDLSNAQERIAHHERVVKDRTEDCSLLVQQLAESELKVEELEAVLSRIRGERDELRVAREDLRSKAAALAVECQRLSRSLTESEAVAGKSKSVLEDEVVALRQLLSAEKEQASTALNELRTLEARAKSLESSSSHSLDALRKQLKELQEARDILVDDNTSLKAALEDAFSHGLEEKSTLAQDLRDASIKLAERSEALKQSEVRCTKLEQELAAVKSQATDAAEQLRSMRGIELKLVTSESRAEKMKQESQTEVESLRTRLRMLEDHAAEVGSASSEWKHRCERAEQEQQLASKERDRARQEVQDVQARMLVLDGRVADCLVELNSVKSSLEEEKQSHARTQRGIVDQQKLIAQHAEKNVKLNVLLEEQKEVMERQHTRLSELESAGSQAMNVVSFQKEIERLMQERDSSKALLVQKTNEHTKLSHMLVSYEEKLRQMESRGVAPVVPAEIAAAPPAHGGEHRALEKELKALMEEREKLAKEAAESKDWAAKYNNALVENKKLEKRLASQETKAAFLKKKLEKLERSDE